MDTRNREMHAQMTLTGVGKPFNYVGPVTGILGNFVKELVTQNPRDIADGYTEIVIRIRNKPFTDSKEAATLTDKAQEVWAGIDLKNTDIEDSKPRDGESFEDFYTRQLGRGLSKISAQFFACDWFEREQDPELLSWLDDQKAIRFRLLNSVNDVFLAALPGEYESLKQYVLAKYPNMTKHLTFRTA